MCVVWGHLLISEVILILKSLNVQHCRHWWFYQESPDTWCFLSRSTSWKLEHLGLHFETGRFSVPPVRVKLENISQTCSRETWNGKEKDLKMCYLEINRRILQEKCIFFPMSYVSCIAFVQKYTLWGVTGTSQWFWREKDKIHWF